MYLPVGKSLGNTVFMKLLAKAKNSAMAFSATELAVVLSDTAYARPVGIGDQVMMLSRSATLFTESVIVSGENTGSTAHSGALSDTSTKQVRNIAFIEKGIFKLGLQVEPLVTIRITDKLRI